MAANVLVAPLDWGLGHASRCVPVIEAFIQAGTNVILGCTELTGQFFKGLFPNLHRVELPSYGIVYPNCGFEMPFWLLRELPRLRRVIQEEHKCTERLVQSENIQIIFSDNRFGCYSTSAYSVYMTHQMRIAFPGIFKIAEPVGEYLHSVWQRRFSEVWIPDFEEFPGLAGKLSHPFVASCYPHRYVGSLSRFSLHTRENELKNLSKKYRFLGIVSGVEPQRTRFENKLKQMFAQVPGNHALLLGLPGKNEMPIQNGNVTIFNHLPTDAFSKVVFESEYVISRPGYSTVMDQTVLGSNCLFVPTPGQTEQEYLAKTLSSAGFAQSVSERKLSAEFLRRFAQEPARRLPNSQGNFLYDSVQKVLEKI